MTRILTARCRATGFYLGTVVIRPGEPESAIGATEARWAAVGKIVAWTTKLV